MQYQQRICKHCEREFTARRRYPSDHWPEHCSTKCARAARQAANKNLTACGKPPKEFISAKTAAKMTRI